ncbi:tetratricopeptide repeat protein [Streptomyces sp. NPDC002018]|uniref:tetratricopeptide repeat protein n=1 Tax=Streptomyces sp. NPDC002018 TaxID=3364629 RepID=UPI0036BEECAB
MCEGGQVRGPEEDRERRDHNELGGTVHGTAVQAGTVYGGIHIRSEAGAGDGTPHVPWQLPPSAPITNRTAELDALERHRARAARDGHPTLAAISGLGGVGKTAVALAWLHTLRSHFPGGQLYADLGAQSPSGPATPGEVVSRFLRALGVPTQQVPAAFPERAALYRSLTAGRRLVVLLDDAATAAQVRPLVLGGQNVTAVTSRWRMPGLTVDGCYSIHLGPLAPEAAVELLDVTLADGRVAAQPDDARALVELCAGLPLAVRVAGARLAARPRRGIATMVRALTEEHDRLEALAIEGDHNVRAALDLSYTGLPPAAARLYRLLGLHPGPEFSGAAANAVLAEDATELLDVLHDANLLIDAGTGGASDPAYGQGAGQGSEYAPGSGSAPESASGSGSASASGAASRSGAASGSGAGSATGYGTEEERYGFHALVRLHAAAKAREDEPPSEREAALRRIADHYLASATRAEEIVDPQHRTLDRDYGDGPVLVADFGDDPESALDWLERELPNLMAVIHRARPAGFPSVGWQLADALWPLFLRRKFYEQWRAAHEEGLIAARESGNRAAECRMLTSGGVGELGMGSHERALEMFERAAETFRADGDALGHARTLNYRGLAHQRLGRLDRAAEFFGRAAAELPGCGDPRAGGLARLNLADVALARGLHEQAATDADAAYTTLRDEGDPYNAARATTLLGRAYLGLDRLDEAEDRLTVALSALRATAADYETARVLESLGGLAERRGQPGLARDRYREALELYSAAGRSESDGARTVRVGLERLAERSAEQPDVRPDKQPDKRPDKQPDEQSERQSGGETEGQTE